MVAGRRYRANLGSEARGLVVEQVVVAVEAKRRLVVTYEFPEGTALQDFREEVLLEPVVGSSATRVTYRFTYTAPGLLDKLATSLHMRTTLEEATRDSLSKLVEMANL